MRSLYVLMSLCLKKVLLSKYVCCSVLERVADGEVDRVGFLEAGDVEVAGLPRVVGEVEGDAPVETDDEEAEVVAQANPQSPIPNPQSPINFNYFL